MGGGESVCLFYRRTVCLNVGGDIIQSRFPQLGLALARHTHFLFLCVFFPLRLSLSRKLGRKLSYVAQLFLTAEIIFPASCVVDVCHGLAVAEKLDTSRKD